MARPVRAILLYFDLDPTPLSQYPVIAAKSYYHGSQRVHQPPAYKHPRVTPTAWGLGDRLDVVGDPSGRALTVVGGSYSRPQRGLAEGAGQCGGDGGQGNREQHRSSQREHKCGDRHPDSPLVDYEVPIFAEGLSDHEGC